MFLKGNRKRTIALIMVLVIVFTFTPLDNILSLVGQIDNNLMQIDVEQRAYAQEGDSNEDSDEDDYSDEIAPNTATDVNAEQNVYFVQKGNINDKYPGTWWSPLKVEVDSNADNCNYYLCDPTGARYKYANYTITKGSDIAQVNSKGKVERISGKAGFVRVSATIGTVTKGYTICFYQDPELKFKESSLETTVYSSDYNILYSGEDEIDTSKRQVSYSVLDSQNNPTDAVKVEGNGRITKRDTIGSYTVIAKVAKETVTWPWNENDTNGYQRVYSGSGEARYSLTISPDDTANSRFENTEINEKNTLITYGDWIKNDLIVPPYCNKASISYTVPDSDKDVVKILNDHRVLIIGDVNEARVITVTATLPNSPGFYSGCTKQYSFTIVPNQMTANKKYDILGGDEGLNGWYKGTNAPYIQGRTGENGLEYHLSNKAPKTEDEWINPQNFWKNTIAISEGVNSYDIYAREYVVKDGEAHYHSISQKKTIEVKWDKELDYFDLDPNNESSKWYSSDIKVNLKARDSVSGLGTYSYYTVVDGKASETTTVDLEGKKETTNEAITLSAKEFDGKIVTLHVTMTDVAGNAQDRTITRRFDSSNPQITVNYDNNNSFYKTDNHGYFNNTRIATVKIVEPNLDLSKTVIDVKATDKNGTVIKTDELITVSDWRSSDNITYYATVMFYGAANYEWTVSCVDTAGNANNAVDYGKSVTPKNFTVDTDKPTGEIKIAKMGAWDKFLTKVGLGKYASETLAVTLKTEDKTSPIYSTKYIKTTSTTALTIKELEAVTAWKDFENVEIATDEESVIYAQIIDCAGNTTYLSTDKIISETKAPEIEITLPENKEGIYNADVKASVKIKDANDRVSSGLKKVDYTIFNMGEATESANIFVTDDKTIETEGLKTSLSKDINISATNNSNDVMLVVVAEDNAGNKETKVQKLKIDTTSPSISVDYDNNAVVNNGGKAYFKASRTATVTISERNFDPAKVVIEAENSDGAAPELSDWTTIKGTGNKDNTKHVIKISYTENGEYSFKVSYTDEAKNANSEVAFGTSAAPKTFIIDKDAPEVTVSYDNNAAANDNYYKAGRTATIKVKDHNFDADAVEFKSETTPFGGKQTTGPAISGWTKNGDDYTATVTFADNGYYEWSFAIKDKAGNEGNTIDKQEFNIDTEAPEVKVEGIEKNTAYNTEKNIGVSVTCTDAEGNLDECDVNLTLVKMNADGSFSNVPINFVVSSITDGKEFVIGNLENDGKYTLSYKVVDKAGNAKDTAIDGSWVFSINRDGSVYFIDENSYSSRIFENYYNYEISKDIEIKEVDVDRLKNYKISVNGEALKENVDYRVEKSDDSNSAWCLYTYVINKSLFTDEGAYSIVVESENKTATMSYSDIKALSTKFVIDKTTPVLTLSGISSDSKYQTEEQEVTAIPTDDGSGVKNFKVVAYDSNGKALQTEAGEDVSVRFDMEGEELDKYLEENDGKISFTVPEGENLSVEVSCADYTLDLDGKATNVAVERYDNITVLSKSASIFDPEVAKTDGVIDAKADNRIWIIVCAVAGIIVLSGGVIFTRRKKSAK